VDVGGSLGWFSGTLSAGSFFLEHADGRRKTLRFGAVQAGAGLSIPVDLDFYTREMVSGGTQIYGDGTNVLTNIDFEGNFLIFPSAQISVLAGIAGLVIFFGVGEGDLDRGEHRSVGAIAGATVGLQLGIGVSGGIGRVFLATNSWAHA